MEEDKGVGNGEGWRNLGRESMDKAMEGEVSVNIGTIQGKGEEGKGEGGEAEALGSKLKPSL